MDFSIVLFCTGTVLYWVSTSVALKSHSLSLVRVDVNSLSKEWVDVHYAELRRLDKIGKTAYANMTFLKTLDGNNVSVEIKAYQKMGGKYAKAPLHFPKKPLCEYLERDTMLWPCVQNHTNFPKKCPILKGEYWVKQFDPNNCAFGSFLPPNMPEDYKFEIRIWDGFAEVFDGTSYSKLKKKLPSVPAIPFKF